MRAVNDQRPASFAREDYYESQDEREEPFESGTKDQRSQHNFTPQNVMRGQTDKTDQLNSPSGKPSQHKTPNFNLESKSIDMFVATSQTKRTPPVMQDSSHK